MGEIIKDETKYKPQESQWLTLEEGVTTIRILSHSYAFKSHYIKSEKKSYDCTGDTSTCEWCQKSNRPRGRWAYIVLVRDSKEPVAKVVEFGWSVFETILALAKDKDYGDPRGYDLKITKTGTGLDTNYTVIPGKETDFTEEEMKMLEPKGLTNVDKATDYLLSFYKKEGEEESIPEEEGEEEIPF